MCDYESNREQILGIFEGKRVQWQKVFIVRTVTKI